MGRGHKNSLPLPAAHADAVKINMHTEDYSCAPIRTSSAKRLPYDEHCHDKLITHHCARYTTKQGFHQVSLLCENGPGANDRFGPSLGHNHVIATDRYARLPDISHISRIYY